MSWTISVITVSYNAAATIEQTLRSVIDQTYGSIEYIVIDGGSTDGTKDIVQTYQSSLAYWISEPDRGIADAMNKGLKRATGRYVLYLNADDYLTDPNAIKRVARKLDTAIVAGPIIRLDRNSEERIVRPRGFNWWFNLKTGLFHQATFCSRKLLLKLGGFNTDCKLEMDYDMFLRAYRRQVPIRIIAEPFSVMREGGISTRNDPVTLEKRFVEEREIHYRNCRNRVMQWFYSAYWRLYPPYRRLLTRPTSVEQGDRG